MTTTISDEILSARSKLISECKSLEEVIRSYKLITEHGTSDAQFDLGKSYKEGTGIEKDIKEAIKFYKLSAEQGNPHAQHNLGLCYEYGDGVNQDLKEAIRLYKLSAKQGNSYAQFSLALHYENGDGVQMDLKEAARLYKLCSDQSDNDVAQYKLANFYEFGTGVEEDKKEAIRLYKLSATQGNKSAQYKLKTFYESERRKDLKENKNELIRLYTTNIGKGTESLQCNFVTCCEYSTESESDAPEYKLECSPTKHWVDIVYKREPNKDCELCVDEECDCNDVHLRYNVNCWGEGDLAAYGVPDEIFESNTLTKRDNLLEMFNEYVKEFGNIRGEYLENYFNAPGACDYEYEEFIIGGSATIKIVNHDKMKIFIEMIKTVIDYFAYKW